MVCYKGGAGIRGPQSTGLVLGKADYIRDCRANGFPNQAVLRAAKVCKEEVFGLVAAVEGFMAEDDSALVTEANREMQTIVDAVSPIPGIRAEVIDKGEGSGPRALINVRRSDGWKGPLAPEILSMMLDRPRKGHPRLFCGRQGESYAPADYREDCFTITYQMLQPGEVAIVRDILTEVLGDLSRGGAEAGGAKL